MRHTHVIFGASAVTYASESRADEVLTLILAPLPDPSTLIAKRLVVARAKKEALRVDGGIRSATMAMHHRSGEPRL